MKRNGEELVLDGRNAPLFRCLDSKAVAMTKTNEDRER